MIDRHHFLVSGFDRTVPRELALLSIIAQSYFQPFSLEDNLLVILTALTSGSGVGFNRAMLFLRQGNRLKGEMWLGPRSAEEAGLIWDVLSTPGIGYVEIIEHNRTLISKNEDTLTRRINGLLFPLNGDPAVVPGMAALERQILHVREASGEPLIDKRFRELIGVEEFLCVPLLAREDVVGEIVLDNAITGTPISAADINLAGLCGLIAGNYIASTLLHRRVLDMEKMAAMGEMAMFVTHQLRNPIVAIGGFTEQLLKPDLPEEKKSRNLAIIRDEVRRLEDIIFQMGHFLKVSLKEPVFFDPRPVLEAVLQAPDIQDRAKAYNLVTKVDESPPEILCDPTSFGEVVRNLLDNAFDATPPGGTIAVRGSRREGGQFTLTVRDTGRGISKPDQDQLFRPFFTTKEKGMGLGLPFIKRVMDTCGGRIEVQSQVGKGALFKLTFVSREKKE